MIGQVSASGQRPQFNLCVCDEVRLRDLSLALSFKAVAGKIDQGGGPIWRYQDPKNYYVARMNPLEDNFRVYKVRDGVRTQLASADAKLPAGEWHRIRISQVGDRIRCYLDDKLLLDVRDGTFLEAGKIGLWTKADAVTYFRDINAHAPDNFQLTTPQPVAGAYPGLHRLMRISEAIYSGAEPEGPVAFESLHGWAYGSLSASMVLCPTSNRPRSTGCATCIFLSGTTASRRRPPPR